MLGARVPRIARIYELHRRVTQLSDAIFHRHKFYRQAKLSNSPIVHRPGRAKRILSLYLTSVELRFIRVTATYELVRSGAITQLFRALETIVHTAFDSFSTRMSTNFFAWPERNGASVGNLISGSFKRANGLLVEGEGKIIRNETRGCLALARQIHLLRNYC